MEPTLQKLPPQSIEAEESFLSACLLGAAQDGTELLIPDDFYRTAHQKIFKVICNLVASDTQVDMITVIDSLRNDSALEECGGASYIARIIDTVPSASSLVDIAKIIKSASQKRRIIKACSDTIQNCYNGKPVSEILERLDMDTSKIPIHSGAFYKLGDLLPGMLEKWEKMQVDPNPPGIRCGLVDIDKMFGGFQMGLYVIGGRPGMGKTALGMRLSRGASDYGFASFQISLEMSKEQLLTRETSFHSGVDGNRFNTGDMDMTHWNDIARSCEKIEKLNVYVDDSPTATIKEIQSKIRNFVKQHGKSLIIIDYLDYIKGVESDRKDLEIGTVTKGLKAAAKNNDVPVILFVQLNRNCDNRDDKRPRISDLRNSGEIEQDADVVAFLYQDQVYNPETNDVNVGEFIVRKYRHGRTGTIYLRWIPHRTTYENLQR